MTDPFTRCEFDGEDLILRLELTIPGSTAAIRPVVEKVMWVVQQMGCGYGKEFEIETALQESLANAVVHGCGEDPEKLVQFVVVVSRELAEDRVALGAQEIGNRSLVIRSAHESSHAFRVYEEDQNQRFSETPILDYQVVCINLERWAEIPPGNQGKRRLIGRR